MFKQYYAPLNYKESRFGFNFSELKQKYLDAAPAANTNEKFYALMNKFVAEFKDAHTQAVFTESELPARSRVAYLGFKGKRVGQYFVVTNLLPTSSDVSFPIKIGDIISKADGLDLVQYVKTKLIKFRDFGNDEANLTGQMGNIFSRYSLEMPIPTEKNITLNVISAGVEKTITLPWVVKDLYVFKKEQNDALNKDKKTKTETAQTLTLDVPADLRFEFGFLNAENKIINILPEFMKYVRGAPGFNFFKTFKLFNYHPVWGVAETTTPTVADATDPFSELRKVRYVPTEAIPVTGAKIFPSYITREEIVDQNGNGVGSEALVGYIYISTFSTAESDAVALSEFKNTVKTLRALGVQRLIIDTIGNGGGSLLLGLEMAQALTNTKVAMPEIQFMLSDSKIDEFEQNSLMAPTDAERELNKRIYEALLEDQNGGQRLSRRFSSEELFAFPLQPDTLVKGTDFVTVLLVDETCASMCDIFAGVLQDNQIGVVLGARTMGAGGNVVMHVEAPNSHMRLAQTESLLLRADGTYLENNGVTPNVLYPVNATVLSQYEPVKAYAVRMLTTKFVAETPVVVPEAAPASKVEETPAADVEEASETAAPTPKVEPAPAKDDAGAEQSVPMVPMNNEDKDGVNVGDGATDEDTAGDPPLAE